MARWSDSWRREPVRTEAHWRALPGREIVKREVGRYVDGLANGWHEELIDELEALEWTDDPEWLEAAREMRQWTVRRCGEGRQCLIDGNRARTREILDDILRFWGY